MVRRAHHKPARESAVDPRSVAAQDLDASWDMQGMALAGIFGLLLLWVLYFGRDILVPITFAFVLNLLLQPAAKVLCRLGIPKPVAALLTLLTFLGVLLLLGATLAGPLSAWVARAPESLPRLEGALGAIQPTLERVQDANRELERLAQSVTGSSTTISLAGPGIGDFLFSSSRALATGLGTTVLVLYFLLVSGDLFLRRLVEILPTLSDKKQLVEISHEIERSVSGYLITVTLINIGVGFATGIATYLCGLPDPLLWGAIAFLLNYVLILGPLTNLAILLIVGLMSFDSAWRAAIPALAYLTIHVVEGEGFTPMIVARRFTLNPVLIVLSLIFWFWMWGIAGGLLAVPLLAILKMICDRIAPLAGLGHFLGG
jgi:predicted PurR-regulated permease PerM